MKITENNCEEYFLLYADDELNSAERNAVEAFVQQHPQHKAALDGLLKTKLSSDKEHVFFNKNLLLRNEEKEIGSHNYEDYFLLYTDNELSKEEREDTERFVLQHPNLQAEFILLQQTRLPVENIEFRGKEKLYKREKRVVPLYATRLAIAASVVGVIVFSWLLIVSNKQHNNIAFAKPVVHHQHQVVTPAQKNVPLSNNILPQEPLVVKKIVQKQIIKPKIATQKTNLYEQSNDDKNEVAIDKEPTIVNTVVTPEVAQTAIHKEPIASANKTLETLKPLEEVNVEDMRTQTALLVSADDNTAKPAVYKELHTDDDAHTLYVASLQLNKAKVNGIIKSASRLLGGRAKQNVD
ncbi:MAG: hypothetical protein M3R72_01805 [Bacteroidota bacterium]|nr:hypothetical protein [Bacteroidota bacterium]